MQINKSVVSFSQRKYMLKTTACAFLLFAYTLAANAQNLSGTWVGGGGGTSVRIVLVKSGIEYVGYTYDKDAMGFCHTNFTAAFDSANKKFKGRSTGFIDHSFMHAQTNYNLRYTAKNVK